MMSPLKQTALVLLLAVGLGACAQQSTPADLTAEATSQTDKHTFHATVKPGAAVEFVHRTSGPLEVGEQGFVEFTVRDGYDGGTIVLAASESEGLSVFGASTSATMDMSGDAPHIWRVNFSADAEGVQYLRVRADVSPDEGLASTRAYAARIEVGDIDAAAAQKTTPVQVTPQGERVVIMEAEETIE